MRASPSGAPRVPREHNAPGGRLFFAGRMLPKAPRRFQTTEAGMEFHVLGDVMQAVVIPLGRGEEVQAEAGAMLYMAGDVVMDTSMRGGLWGGLKRIVAGESLFMTRFRCGSQGQ